MKPNTVAGSPVDRGTARSPGGTLAPTPPWIRTSNTGSALRDQSGQVDQAGRVTPFVVVPTENLHQPTGGLGQARVKHTRRAVADHIRGDHRFSRVPQPTRQRADRTRRLER